MSSANPEMPTTPAPDAGKPWFRSLTIVPTLIATLVSWAATNGLITGAEQDAGQTLLASLVSTVEHLMAFIAVVGMRRAISPIQTPTINGPAVAASSIALLFAAGCVSYNAGAVSAAANTYQGSEFVSQEECDAFRGAAADLEEGPDRALAGIGNGGDLKLLSIDLMRQGAVCDQVFAMGELTVQEFSQFRTAFDRTWAAAREAVE